MWITFCTHEVLSQTVRYLRRIFTIQANFLAKEDCFHAERWITCPLVCQHDLYYGSSLEEAKKLPEWDFANDCAFLQVTVDKNICGVTSSLDWVRSFMLLYLMYQSKFCKPASFDRLHVNENLLMIAYSSTMRKSVSGEYACLRGYISEEVSPTLSSSQALDFLIELRGVFGEWDNKYAARGKVQPYHEEATGFMIPHSCPGVGGSCGSGIVLLDSVLRSGELLLVGIRKYSSKST